MSDIRPRRTRRQATRWDTQDDAYANSLPRAGTIAARVLEALRSMPQTCDELEVNLNLRHQTCSASVNSLMKVGIIKAIDKRPTRSGYPANVWAVVQADGRTESQMPETLFPMPPLRYRT